MFMSITRTSHFLNITYSIVGPLYIENCSGNYKYACNKDEICVSIHNIVILFVYKYTSKRETPVKHRKKSLNTFIFEN